MIIKHNISAMNSRRSYGRNTSKLKKSLEKLSSGFSVNRSADNAAGLAVSEKMRSQLAGIDRAAYNCEDAISMVQTFESALKAAAALVQRCKQLAAQCANGTYQDEPDRAAMQLEYQQLCDEVDHVADTDFNGVVMINGCPTVNYTDLIEQVPYESAVTEPVLDEFGNPLLDPEAYRLSADFTTGGPFVNETGRSHAMFAPVFVPSNGSGYIHTAYGDGSTDKLTGSLTGNVTAPDGSVQPVSFNYSVSNSSSFSLSSYTDTSGNTVYTSTVPAEYDISSITGIDGDTAKVNIVQKATQTFTYLTDAQGNIVTDANGEKVPTAALWDISYEIVPADDSSSNFSLTSADMKLFSDTVFDTSSGHSGDINERYYTSDTSNGHITQEHVYTSGDMIESFSSYFYNLEDDTFNDLSNKIVIGGSNPPSEIGLGLYQNGIGNRISDDFINPGDDLAYYFKWSSSNADGSGKITFSAGQRGLSNSNSDTNISPKIETKYRDILTTKENYIYHDAELVVQANSRTKDSVKFTFEYFTESIGDLECDLNCSAIGLGLDKLSIETRESANSAIDRLDHALNKISMVRAEFGAVQNRLEHKIDNLRNTQENITAAESQIRDTDMAAEMTEFTKNQILSQSSQAMLVQANTLPQSVMSLIET